MSLFFLLLTGVTYFLSHYWARLNQPSSPIAFDKIKLFKGSLETFTEHLNKQVSDNPHWMILEKTKNRFVIGEAPGLFHYGCFYHIQCTETKKGLKLEVTTQSRLIGSIASSEKLNKHLFNIAGFEDVG